MRALFLVSISTAVLTACASTEQSPIYQQSTGYQNSAAATQQYAAAPATQSTVTQAAHSTTYSQGAYSQESYAQGAYTTTANHISTEAYPVLAHPYPHLAQAEPTALVQNDFTYETAPAYDTPSTVATWEPAPIVSDYGTQDIIGTPGYLAVQGQSQTVTTYDAVPAPQPVQTASSPVYGKASTYTGAGTPVAYDISRNLITADALTTGQQPAETVRQLQGSMTGQSYIVQPGDTVYSLSRRTCVGVSVIQSMNGLGADYGINIGQSLTLPTPVC